MKKMMMERKEMMLMIMRVPCSYQGEEELTRFGRLVGILKKNFFFFVLRLLRQLGFASLCLGFHRETEIAFLSLVLLWILCGDLHEVLPWPDWWAPCVHISSKN